MKNKEARQRFERADRLYREQRFDEALAVLSELNAAYPNEKNILFPIARSLNRLYRTNEALVLCDQLIQNFNDPRAVELKQRILQGTQGGDIELGELPDLNDTVIKGLPKKEPIEEPPFWKSVPVMVSGGLAAALVLMTIGLFIFRGVPEKPVEQVAAADVTATEAEPAEERLSEGGFALRIVLAILVLGCDVIATLYVTLVLLRKLPGQGFVGDFISVGAVALGTAILSVVCCIIGPFIAGYIIRQTYEFNFIEYLIYGAVGFFFVAPCLFLINTVILPAEYLDELGIQLYQETAYETYGEDVFAGEYIPEGNIAVDGDPSEWSNATPLWDGSQLETPNGVQYVKLAEDGSYLYGLVAFDQPISEAFNARYDGSDNFAETTLAQVVVTEVYSDMTMTVRLSLIGMSDPDGASDSLFPGIRCSVDGSDPAVVGSSLSLDINTEQHAEDVRSGWNLVEFRVPAESVFVEEFMYGDVTVQAVAY